jgi:hypothetical protein
MKLPKSRDNPTGDENNKIPRLSHKEAMLVRKSSDYTPRISSLGKEGPGSSASGAVGLAEGIGIDTRKYIESLLSLNR